MKPSGPGGPPPLLGLVAALVVLVAGIASALTRSDSGSEHSNTGAAVTTTRPQPTATTVVASTPTTQPPASSASSTTVRAAVPSPEAAANGLWAAYSATNREAAARFATEEVVDTLFVEPYDGENGAFQGCRMTGDRLFDCTYEQPSHHYRMTAQGDDAGRFTIVVIEISS